MKNSSNQALLTALNDCAAACNMCATACLDESDVKALAQCIKLDMDCAEICRLTAAFVARGSAHAAHILPECAEICTACAAECSKHTHMEHCKICADACKKCADACRQMATMK